MAEKFLLGKLFWLAACSVRKIPEDRAELEWREWEEGDGYFMTKGEWQATAEEFLASVRTSIGDTPALQSTEGVRVDGIRYSSWCDKHRRGTPCDKCAAAGVAPSDRAQPVRMKFGKRITPEQERGELEYRSWIPRGVPGTVTTATGEVLREGEDYERTAGVPASTQPSSCVLRWLGNDAAPAICGHCRKKVTPGGACALGVPRLDSEVKRPQTPSVSGDSEANKEKGE